MELKDRIIKYILNNPGVNMDTIISEATSKGISQHEVLVALDVVHKDKRITHTATASGVVTYKPATAKVSTVPTHVTWLTANYPRPGVGDIPSFIMPFPEIDLSHIFMTRDEAKEYKAAASGRPIYMMKKHYA